MTWVKKAGGVVHWIGEFDDEPPKDELVRVPSTWVADERDRKVRLFDLQGLDVTEISRRASCSVEHVRTVLAEADKARAEAQARRAAIWAKART